MKIDRIHFYVEDAKAWRDWFVGKLGFQAVASSSSDRYTDTEVVKSGFVCFALSSPRSPFSPVWQFLRHHPPGVADVAFVVEDLENIIQRAIAHGAKVLQPLQLQQGCKWGKISAWGSLCHTLIERREEKGQGELALPHGVGIRGKGDKETRGQFNSKFKIQNSKFKIQNSKFKILPTPDSPLLVSTTSY
jgi:4-hydroxyphenylpyruvate dioxygenase-like putative hemolysin